MPVCERNKTYYLTPPERRELNFFGTPTIDSFGIGVNIEPEIIVM